MMTLAGIDAAAWYAVQAAACLTGNWQGTL